MNEIILDLAALALALFCLIDSVRERRDPLPKRPGAMLRDRRAVYIAALGALLISAAASAARGLGLRLGATEAIRKLDRPDARTIPIIALTANAFEEDVKQCLQAGMDAHLSKPVDIEKLKDTLRRLLAARG